MRLRWWKKKPPTEFDPRTAARIFDVPPWMVDGNYPTPRFAGLRWKLRRIWPV